MSHIFVYIYWIIWGKCWRFSENKDKVKPLNSLNFVSGYRYMLRYECYDKEKYESCNIPKSYKPIIFPLNNEKSIIE